MATSLHKPYGPVLTNDPINDGCVLALPCFGTAGTTLEDISGNGNNGTLVLADISDGGADDPPVEGRYISFDGATNHADVAHTSGMPVYNQTAYSLFIRFRGASVAAARWMFGEGNASAANQFFGLSEQGGGSATKLTLYMQDDAAAVKINSQSVGVVWDGGWHTAVITDAAGTWEMHVDGFLALGNSGSYVPTATTLDLTTLGALGRTSYTNRFAVDIADVRAWNRILTATEITTLATTAWYGYTQPEPLSRQVGVDFNKSVDLEVVAAGGGLGLYTLEDRVALADEYVVVEEAFIENVDADYVELGWLHPSTITGLPTYQPMRRVLTGAEWSGHHMRQVSPYPGARLVCTIYDSAGPCTGTVRCSGRVIK